MTVQSQANKGKDGGKPEFSPPSRTNDKNTSKVSRIQSPKKGSSNIPEYTGTQVAKVNMPCWTSGEDDRPPLPRLFKPNDVFSGIKKELVSVKGFCDQHMDPPVHDQDVEVKVRLDREHFTYEMLANSEVEINGCVSVRAPLYPPRDQETKGLVDLVLVMEVQFPREKDYYYHVENEVLSRIRDTLFRCLQQLSLGDTIRLCLYGNKDFQNGMHNFADNLKNMMDKHLSFKKCNGVMFTFLDGMVNVHKNLSASLEFAGKWLSREGTEARRANLLLVTHPETPLINKCDFNGADKDASFDFLGQLLFGRICSVLPKNDRLSVSCFEFHQIHTDKKKQFGHSSNNAHLLTKISDEYGGQVHSCVGLGTLNDALILCMSQEVFDVALDDVVIDVELPKFIEANHQFLPGKFEVLKGSFLGKCSSAGYKNSVKVRLGNMVYGSKRDAPLKFVLALKNAATLPKIVSSKEAKEQAVTDDIGDDDDADRCLLCLDVVQDRLFSCTRDTTKPCKFALCNDCSSDEMIASLTATDDGHSKCPNCNTQAFIFKRKKFAANEAVVLRAPVAISSCEVLPSGTPGWICDDQKDASNIPHLASSKFWRVAFPLKGQSQMIRMVNVPETLLDTCAKMELPLVRGCDDVMIQEGNLVGIKGGKLAQLVSTHRTKLGPGSHCWDTCTVKSKTGSGATAQVPRRSLHKISREEREWLGKCFNVNVKASYTTRNYSGEKTEQKIFKRAALPIYRAGLNLHHASSEDNQLYIKAQMLRLQFLRAVNQAVHEMDIDERWLLILEACADIARFSHKHRRKIVKSKNEFLQEVCTIRSAVCAFLASAVKSHLTNHEGAVQVNLDRIKVDRLSIMELLHAIDLQRESPVFADDFYAPKSKAFTYLQKTYGFSRRSSDFGLRMFVESLMRGMVEEDQELI